MMINSAVSTAPAFANVQRHAQAMHWSFTWDAATIVGMGDGAQSASYDNLFRGGITANGPAIGLSTALHLSATFACTLNSRSISDAVGDRQGVINLDAASRCRPYTLSAAQDFNDSVNARMGLVPADLYFDVADSAADLLNSSFGAEPTWSHNTVAPIYPTAGVGVMVTWRRGAWLDRAGIFQASPNKLDGAFRQGALLIDELMYDDVSVGRGTYKIGFWSYHPHNRMANSSLSANWGLYFIAEHSLAGCHGTSTAAFFRLGLSPNSRSDIPLDLQIGVMVPALLPERPDDQLSLGLAAAELHGGRIETAFEVTYVLAVSGHISLQPDLQYVAHPDGRSESATVLALLLHLQFN